MNFRDYIYDWLVGLFFISLPFVVFQQIAGSLAEQGAVSGGPLQNAAIFPQILAWFIIILCVINAFQIFRQQVTTSPLSATPTTGLALMCSVLFIAYLFSINLLGFYLATPILLAALFFFFGIAIQWCVLGGLIATVIIAAIFEGVLNVVLPLGWLRFTLFG